MKMKKITAAALCLMLAVMVFGTTAFAAVVEVDSWEKLAAEIGKGGTQEIKLIGSFGNDGKSIKLPTGSDITLNLNGKTITAVDPNTEQNTSGNFQLFMVQNGAKMKIKDSTTAQSGVITLKANTDRDFNALSTIVGVYGDFTLESGSLTHLGGTDMAYVVDVYDTSGTASFIMKGGTITSTYRAVRSFAAHESYKTNIEIQGGTIYGKQCGIWMQHASANPGEETLKVSGGSITGVERGALYADADNSGNLAKTKFEISGGEFSSNAKDHKDKPMPANIRTTTKAGDTSTFAPSLTGGDFSNDPSAYLKGSGSALLVKYTANGETRYITGTNSVVAKKIESLPSGSAAEVLSGSVDFDKLPSGVTVMNNSKTGSVTVNGKTVEYGQSAAGNYVPGGKPGAPSGEDYNYELWVDPAEAGVVRSPAPIPQTGDSTPVMLFAALLTLSAAGMFMMLLSRKKA